jgi:hypothetical protein
MATMNHLKLFISMGLTCVLAAFANVTIAQTAGLNVFGYKVWVITPIGAMFIGFTATSGAVLAARYFKIKPNWIDALAMLTLAGATTSLIYLLDCSALVGEDRSAINKLTGVKNFLDPIWTKAQFCIDRGAHDADAADYVLAAIDFLGFVAGGAASLFFIRGMRKCEQCAGYVRKLGSATTPVLSFDETRELLDMFETGDLPLMQKLIAWRPEENNFEPRRDRATITYDLYSCANCRSEEIIVSVRTFTGKKWKEAPSLSARRLFVADSPLRHAFP